MLFRDMQFILSKILIPMLRPAFQRTWPFLSNMHFSTSSASFTGLIFLAVPKRKINVDRLMNIC